MSKKCLRGEVPPLLLSYLCIPLYRGWLGVRKGFDRAKCPMPPLMVPLVSLVITVVRTVTILELLQPLPWIKRIMGMPLVQSYMWTQGTLISVIIISISVLSPYTHDCDVSGYLGRVNRRYSVTPDHGVHDSDLFLFVDCLIPLQQTYRTCITQSCYRWCWITAWLVCESTAPRHTKVCTVHKPQGLFSFGMELLSFCRSAMELYITV